MPRSDSSQKLAFRVMSSSWLSPCHMQSKWLQSLQTEMPSSDIALSFPLLLMPFTISIRWGWWWCWFVSTSAANGGLVGENQLPPWIPSSSRSWLPCGWSSALIQVNGLPSLVFSTRLCRISPYLSTIPWSFSPLEGSGCPLHRSGTDRLRRGQVFHSHYPMFPVELVVLEDVDHDWVVKNAGTLLTDLTHRVHDLVSVPIRWVQWRNFLDVVLRPEEWVTGSSRLRQCRSNRRHRTSGRILGCGYWSSQHDVIVRCSMLCSPSSHNRKAMVCSPSCM